MLVIAHRGYSEKYPENTLRAFEEAIRLNAPAIELDVHLSKDKELIVTHDYQFGRCVKLPSEKNILDYNFSELIAADAGSFKDSSFKNEKIPSLKSVLKLVQSKCLLNIEIKKETLHSLEDYNTMVQKLAEVTNSYDLNKILFSSFDPYALKTLRVKLTQARIAYLDDCAHKGPKIEEAKSLNAETYNINLKRSSVEVVKHIQDSGLKVFAYTAKTLADLSLAKSLNVDGIFADNLEEALSFFKPNF